MKTKSLAKETRTSNLLMFISPFLSKNGKREQDNRNYSFEESFEFELFGELDLAMVEVEV